jgi:hypothetical protein
MSRMVPAPNLSRDRRRGPPPLHSHANASDIEGIQRAIWGYGAVDVGTPQKEWQLIQKHNPKKKFTSVSSFVR